MYRGRGIFCFSVVILLGFSLAVPGVVITNWGLCLGHVGDYIKPQNIILWCVVMF